MIKKEIYLVTSEVRGVPMDFDAYETKAEAVEAALTINKVAGNENARIQPINLLSRADDSAALRAERNELRYILACIAPYCLACGRDKGEVCPAGFPGCGMSDDLSVETPELKAKAEQVKNAVESPLRARVEALGAENKRFRDALVDAVESMKHAEIAYDCGISFKSDIEEIGNVLAARAVLEGE